MRKKHLWREQGIRLESYLTTEYKGDIEAFCKALGIKERTMWEYISGKRNPIRIGLDKLIAAGIDIKYLMTGTPIVTYNDVLIAKTLESHGIKTAAELVNVIKRAEHSDWRNGKWCLFGMRAIAIHYMSTMSNN